MACEGGCVNGPSSLLAELASKKNREALQKEMDDRTVISTVEKINSEYHVHMHK